VFCLVRAERAPSLRRAPDTVPGAGPLRVLRVDRGVWAAVADAPVERFNSTQLEAEFQDVEAISRHALAHAAVIEFLFRKSTVLPLKLLTLFSSDDAAVTAMRRQLRRVRPLFAELAGREEWAVRVVVEPPPAQSSSGPASGRAYLAAKKRLIRGDGAARLAVKKASSALAALSRHAVRVRKDAFPPPAAGRPFVAGASMLVPVKNRKRWKQATSKVASSLAGEGNRLEVSGPWPPYRFVSGR
jgi:hypothetical protein